MIIKIIAVGKLKKGAQEELSTYYHQLFSKICIKIGITKLTIEEVEALPLYQSSKKNYPFNNPNAYSIALDEKGKSFTSIEFSTSIQKHLYNKIQSLIFFIGGHDGIDLSVKNSCNETFSLGKLTWTHQMARILLMEQLYRSTCILTNHPYHRH